MRAAIALCCLALVAAGCAPRPPEGFHAALAARFGPRVQIGYLETEPKGSRATCGYLSDRAMQEGMFVFVGGALKTSKDPGFAEAYSRECPSMPSAIYVVGLISEDAK